MLRKYLPWLIGVGLVVSLALGAFVAAYTLRDGDSEAGAQPNPEATPDLSATPLPMSTPDTTQPFWHVPYENAERQKPKFRGMLAGIEIDPQPSDVDARAVCPSGFEATTDALDRVAEGPLAVKVESLPTGVVPLGGPEVLVCAGETWEVGWTFEVRAGTIGVEETGSGLSILRGRGLRRIFGAGSPGRWSEVTVGGKPAALLAPIVEADGRFVGGCQLAWRDEGTDVLTKVFATAGSPEFCVQVAEALQK